MKKELACPVCHKPVAVGADRCDCCETTGLTALFLTEQDYKEWLKRERARYKADCADRLEQAAQEVCVQLRTSDRAFVRELAARFPDFVKTCEDNEMAGVSSLFEVKIFDGFNIIKDMRGVFMRAIWESWAHTVYNDLTKMYTKKLIENINAQYARKMTRNGWGILSSRPFDPEREDNWTMAAFWPVFDEMECGIATGACGRGLISAQAQTFLESEWGDEVMKWVREEHLRNIRNMLTAKNQDLLKQI